MSKKQVVSSTTEENDEIWAGFGKLASTSSATAATAADKNDEILAKFANG